jgi:hypothetical protein
LFYSDNINTDIFGSNLYNQYLASSRAVAAKRSAAMGARNIYHLLGGDPEEAIQEAEECFSVLVEVSYFAKLIMFELSPGSLIRILVAITINTKSGFGLDWSLFTRSRGVLTGSYSSGFPSCGRKVERT